MNIYQIYPRSFCDSNHDGLGDLQGIRQKLPYLASLGVDMLWISPFFKSPMKDFGYDVSDYCAIDPLFGSMEDFEALIEGCKNHDLKVMIDMVLSHSSDQHDWFKESRSSRNNPKSDWYVWADAKADGSAPNNWLSLFGGSAWEWDSSRQQFYLHNFLKEQPDFNFHQPAIRQALLDACRFWFDKGVRGLRLDVCNFYFHHPSLKDNPPRPPGAKDTEGVQASNPYNSQIHIYDKDQPENLDFLAELRKLAEQYPGSTLMGELGSEDSLGIMTSYIAGGVAGGEPLQTAYNFSLFKPQFDGREIAQMLKDFETRLPHGTPTWALSNHDVPRFVSRFLGPEKAQKNWQESSRCFLTFLFCLRGHVILYQGDELGLDEADIPFELLQDPYGIAFYPEFKGRDGCRTPLPWTTERPREKTWLPIPDSHLQRAVSLQESESRSILNFTRALVQWRKTNAWLVKAPLEILSASPQTLVLRRKEPSVGGHTLVAAFNFGDTSQTLNRAGEGEVTLSAYGFKLWENGAERQF